MTAAVIILVLFVLGTTAALYVETRVIAADRRVAGGTPEDGNARLWFDAVRAARFPRSCVRFWWGFLASGCVLLYAREAALAYGAGAFVFLGVSGLPPDPFDDSLRRLRDGRGADDRSGSSATMPVTLYRRPVRVLGVAVVLVLMALSAVLVLGAEEGDRYASVAVSLPVLALVVWQRTVYPEVRLSGTGLILKRYVARVAVPVEQVVRVDAGDGVGVHLADGGVFRSRAWGRTVAQNQRVARRIARFVREARDGLPGSADRPVVWGRDFAASPFAVWLGLVLAGVPSI
ncbi:hypothetical protein A6A08_00240 [Nocardiopsis sp. TSRI0078]|uniref:hypothetical protein n=1 Tax=unclassified Nocardiopsis TaxID=2649073 RepID=UPI00093A0AE4|nr:hypothetical protein [Nocardiopsis sp. TSRI0078]OKI23277.1 hypothetical protein A6A08_00240 [Nocardiopsis sp. TSRI0078]